YYHFEKDSLKGKNRAEGDTIALAFRQGKIDEVLVKGLARGVYEGRNLGRSTKKPGTKQEGNQKP
ncbi:MAG TPA: hypothetical protein DCQ83_03450, partial [Fibrobacteres bacterium]|nr:hypothetical protein [Fibrobacterota bacterium]